MPYRDAIRNVERWRPVHVKDVAPCSVPTSDGIERLGKVFLSKEMAAVAWNGKEECFTGPQVQNFMVLCRRP